MTHEIRNTHEAIDDRLKREMPDYDAQGFWPAEPRIDLLEEMLRIGRRVRDRTQYVPHNQMLARIIGQLEDHQALLRTERHR